MKTKKFAPPAAPYSLLELASLSNSDLLNSIDRNPKITGIATLSDATNTDIAVLHNEKYLKELKKTKAGGCIIHPKFNYKAPEHLPLLVNDNPYKAFALIAQKVYQAKSKESYISEMAYISSTAKIGNICTIEPGVYIGENVRIGEHNIIKANSYIGDKVEIGKNCLIENNVSITNTTIGNACHIYTGARIGQDGFGFASDKQGHYKIPHIGGVIIGNNVEIGANTCIDRGSVTDTIIEDFCRIDNLVHIAHNVKIGKSSIIAAQVGFAGSCTIGEAVAFGGQVGVSGHLTIGKQATILGKSGVIDDIESNQTVIGYPAIPAIQWHRQNAKLKKL